MRPILAACLLGLATFLASAAPAMAQETAPAQPQFASGDEEVRPLPPPLVRVRVFHDINLGKFGQTAWLVLDQLNSRVANYYFETVFESKDADYVLTFLPDEQPVLVPVNLEYRDRFDIATGIDPNAIDLSQAFWLSNLELGDVLDKPDYDRLLAKIAQRPPEPVDPATLVGPNVSLDDAALATLDRSDATRQPYLAADAEAYEPPPAPRADVTIDLAEGLGRFLPQVRQALAKYDFVRFDNRAEFDDHADFMLTTHPDQPLTLVLIDLRYLDLNTSVGLPFEQDYKHTAPFAVELGNLALGDYADRLDHELRQAVKARALVEATRNAPAPLTRTCFAFGGSTRFMQATCSRGSMDDNEDDQYSSTCQQSFGVVRAAEDDADTEQDGADGEARSDGFAYCPYPDKYVLRYSVLNKADRPQYIALFAIEPLYGATRLPLESDGVPVAPGHWVAGGLNLGLDHRLHDILTVASDTPIDTADGLPGAASLSFKSFYVKAVPPELGGGFLDVSAGMAPWAVQIYSTLQYTSGEIASDLAKPRDERAFLIARTAHERDHVCGASLIAPGVLLTAAHCIAKPLYADDGMPVAFERRRVRMGTQRLGEGGLTYAIDGVAVHAGYVAGEHPNDIALLHIEQREARDPMTGRPLSQATVSLPPATPRGDIPARTPLDVFGWGVTGQVAPGANWHETSQGRVNHNPTILGFGPMEKVAWSTCHGKLGGLLGKRMLCAGPRNGERGANNEKNVFTCVGDSGGPLVTGPRGKEVQVGVVSWVKGCGFADYDSVFTDVAAYRRWIDKAKAELLAAIDKAESNPSLPPKERVLLVPDP